MSQCTEAGCDREATAGQERCEFHAARLGPRPSAPSAQVAAGADAPVAPAVPEAVPEGISPAWKVGLAGLLAAGAYPLAWGFVTLSESLHGWIALGGVVVPAPQAENPRVVDAWILLVLTAAAATGSALACVSALRHPGAPVIAKGTAILELVALLPAVALVGLVLWSNGLP